VEGLSARLQRSTNKHTSLFECSRCDVTGKELWVRGLDHASAGEYPQLRTITCNAQTQGRRWHFLQIPL